MIRPFNSLESSFVGRSYNDKKFQFPVAHFFIGQKLGQGGYAKVYKAVEKFTKLELAAKVIDIRGYHQKEIERLRQEVEIHRGLDHPNIVRIYECVQKDSKFYIFMELAKGQELFQHIRERGPISQEKAAKVFSQICQAVKYLHSNGVTHRDIKTENIVIDGDYNAKLIDFGLAKRYIMGKNLLSTFCGSPSYVSPQMVVKKRYNGQKIDIWCLGVMLYTMLQAKLPFDQNGREKRKQNIQNFRWDCPVLSSIEAMQLYQQIFIEQSERIRLKGIMLSRFVNKYNRSPENKELSKIAKQKLGQRNDLNEQIVEEIVHLLSEQENEVKIQILKNYLGPAYCLYNLISDQRDRKNKIKQRSKTLQRQEGSMEKLIMSQEHVKLPKQYNRRSKYFLTPQMKAKYKFSNQQLPQFQRPKQKGRQVKSTKDVFKAPRILVRNNHQQRTSEMKIKQ